MSEYRLEVKQVVDYPRCRIYREFVQGLIADQHIRTTRSSELFHYVVLCCYANFRTSYRRLDGISYTVFPGDWICRVSELMDFMRLRTRSQVIKSLDWLQERGYIRYAVMGHGNVIKYRIAGWRRHNTVLDYNCPCQKETGFFFLPTAAATELISSERCSEMDIILDLWISAVYNDDQVQGSLAGPVAYFRNGSGCPLVSYAELSQRWGISKATVSRVMKKLENMGYVSLLTFPGRYGTAIYLQNYLSTMFQVSDVMVDKEEVAMTLNIKIHTPEPEPISSETDENIVSERGVIVSKQRLDVIASKVLQILGMQGIACAQCEKMKYMLYPLSDDCGCKGEVELTIERSTRLRMDICCADNIPLYTFLLTIEEYKDKGGKNDA